MGSSRLPGKVLSDICGQPALTRLVRRLRRSRKLDDVVLATTMEPADNELVAWAEAENVECFRGDTHDVLARVVGAQRSMDADIVVEVCGDTPLLDVEVIDWAIDSFLANDCDVVSNVGKQTFPQGIDAQVFRLNDLEQIERTVSDAAVREHVSLYFYEHPDLYRIYHLLAPPNWTRPELRLQLDYADDLRLINEIYRQLLPDYGDGFGVAEIISLFDRQPQLAEINQHCEERSTR